MFWSLVALAVVVVLALAVLGLVLVAQDGRAHRLLPASVAVRLNRATAHLNGDAEPPARFTRLFH